MKRLAFFVEGQTELIFVKKLIIEIAGANNVSIKEYKASGGASSSSPRIFKLIGSSSPPTPQYYVLLYNSTTDNRVKSDILDSHARLVTSGYQKILGLQDVRPKAHSDIPQLKQFLKYKVPTKPIPVDVILAVMETEAWFLSEYNHLPRLDSGLNESLVKARLSIDLINDDLEQRPYPSDDLHNVYQLVGKAYKKNKERVERTVDLLDYCWMYLELTKKRPSFKILVDHLDNFFE